MRRPLDSPTISTFALLMIASLLLSGCPKRADVADLGTQPATAQTGSTTPPVSTSRPSSPPSDASPSYSSSRSIISKEGIEQVTPQAPIQEAPARGAGSPAGPAGTAGKGSQLKDIFFDFDKSNIRDDAKPNLAEDQQWLRTNVTAQIIIEGHCDERGTAEYNLALGERRAKTTKDYLVAAGVDAKHLNIISYGKERPFVMGHDEAAWKWNRRAHFVVRESGTR